MGDGDGGEGNGEGMREERGTWKEKVRNGVKIEMDGKMRSGMAVKKRHARNGREIKGEERERERGKRSRRMEEGEGWIELIEERRGRETRREDRVEGHRERREE